jgi:hypothetical protein
VTTPEPVQARRRRLVWIPRSAAPPETCPRCHKEAKALTYSRAVGWRCPKCAPAIGQAIVEFALVFPIMCLLLLGVLAGGLYFLAGVQQASASTTIAGWAAANPTADPDDLAAFAASVSACPAAVVYAVNLVTVTLSCPTIAGELVPALPRVVVTTATAYVADASPSPAPSPSAAP